MGPINQYPNKTPSTSPSWGQSGYFPREPPPATPRSPPIGLFMQNSFQITKPCSILNFPRKKPSTTPLSQPIVLSMQNYVQFTKSGSTQKVQTKTLSTSSSQDSFVNFLGTLHIPHNYQCGLVVSSDILRYFPCSGSPVRFRNFESLRTFERVDYKVFRPKRSSELSRC